MAAEVVVRDVRGATEMAACERLYGEVMGLRPGDGSINPRLLTALQANSGYVLGAFTGETVVGFAYSFLACDRMPEGTVREFYQYSQLTVVARARQGQGVGRQLKNAQRDRCLADGITRMRWAFDPVKTRNAHFNLDVLGARIVDLVPSMYGSDGFGADFDEETDRCIAEWNLERDASGTRSARIFRHPLLVAGAGLRDGGDLLIAMPVCWSRYRGEFGRSGAVELRSRLREQFRTAIDEGLVGVSCTRIDDNVAVYRFTPALGSDIAAEPRITR